LIDYKHLTGELINQNRRLCYMQENDKQQFHLTRSLMSTFLYNNLHY